MPSDSHRILITGGAGFVGANLGVSLASRNPGWEVIAFDNLKRRGSELNLPRLREAGVRFVHGDVRELADLLALDPVNAIIECSAEPSVLAGVDGDTSYAVHTNLMGAYHCLELAKRDDAQFVFLSTSRVYPVDALRSLAYHENSTRLKLDAEQPFPGASAAGISGEFPLAGARTLYGATKLSAELLIAEYAEAFGIKTVIDRCGVIAGPWQMGKVDQGVFTYWMLAHYFGRELSYIGFGGRGKQVRDLLHVEDLVELIDDQLARPDHWAGVMMNVGGGLDCSLSLAETTQLCRDITGREIPVRTADEERPGDIPIYISDCSLLSSHAEWRRARGPGEILADIFEWIRENERVVEATLK